mmetsp:Transcript_50003/g.132918  ORF Transcript_50003/g.132918 Transcript_50003/m.132918 type:complete len:267 (-) Transcript_50003:1291-2091(-)
MGPDQRCIADPRNPRIRNHTHAEVVLETLPQDAIGCIHSNLVPVLDEEVEGAIVRRRAGKVRLQGEGDVTDQGFRHSDCQRVFGAICPRQTKTPQRVCHAAQHKRGRRLQQDPRSRARCGKLDDELRANVCDSSVRYNTRHVHHWKPWMTRPRRCELRSGNPAPCLDKPRCAGRRNGHLHLDLERQVKIAHRASVFKRNVGNPLIRCCQRLPRRAEATAGVWKYIAWRSNKGKFIHNGVPFFHTYRQVGCRPRCGSLWQQRETQRW